ncbi:proline-rich protein 2-like [Dryobates pubescens]|uniref:proline-rich protein 2-like n=1 Tax=Dryobates pubescens TaxID=118200 RepID=UPI0023B9305D|nr:proline-rich protein 2-like [Dryobates pubescens]
MLQVSAPAARKQPPAACPCKTHPAPPGCRRTFTRGWLPAGGRRQEVTRGKGSPRPSQPLLPPPSRGSCRGCRDAAGPGGGTPAQPAAKAQPQPRGPLPSPTRLPPSRRDPDPPRGSAQRRDESPPRLPARPAAAAAQLYLSLPAPGGAFTTLSRQPERRGRGGAGPGGAGRRGDGASAAERPPGVPSVSSRLDPQPALGAPRDPPGVTPHWRILRPAGRRSPRSALRPLAAP